jgi:L-alanine-DL-glutamate epimerase-like enolase superfamily enzyme
VVRLETDTGIVGWGEGYARYAPPVYRELIERLLKPIVVGADPFAVEMLWQRMFRVFTGRSGGVLIEAVAAIDIALWDIMGKAVGQPLYRLLGHNGRHELAAYAAAIGWTDDATAESQVRQCLAWGFKEIKVRLGPPVAAAARRAAFVRDIAGPDIRLSADANRMLDLGDALMLARKLADLDYYWLEEPIAPDDLEGYRILKAKAPIRIAAGESEYTASGIAPLLSERLLGVVQPDVTRAGGITETRRIVGLASAFHVPYSPHVGFSGSICAAASLHLGAAAPNFLSYECMIFASPLRDELTAVPVASRETLVSGCLPVPQGPGLGIEVSEAALQRYAMT